VLKRLLLVYREAIRRDDRVSAIEKGLGIYDLNSFTPAGT
jgi:hypothetical protein